MPGNVSKSKCLRSVKIIQRVQYERMLKEAEQT